MSDFGIGPKGFRRKQYTDIVGEMEMKARELFGESINLSERTFLGLFIRLASWFLSIVWMLAEKVYNSAYVDTAEGVQLDHVGKYIGIVRNPAHPATGLVTFGGDDGTIIPVGFRVSTQDDITFMTTETMTIREGEGTTKIVAVEPGINGNVPAGTITEIVNPVAGIESVVNGHPTTGGMNKETDPEFRDRYERSVAGAGAATLASIYGALLRVSGVRAATVIENTSILPDTNGRPPKSFEAYVLGGAAQDVAQAILDTKAAGIESYGSETVIVRDIAGVEREIKFSYAQEVNIHMRLQVFTNASFPTDGASQIKTSLIQYIGGQDTDVLYVGLSMGDDVIFTRLISAVYRVPGVEDVSLEISTDGESWVQSNVDINQNEVAQTSYAIIEVQDG